MKTFEQLARTRTGRLLSPLVQAGGRERLDLRQNNGALPAINRDSKKLGGAVKRLPSRALINAGGGFARLIGQWRRRVRPAARPSGRTPNKLQEENTPVDR